MKNDDYVGSHSIHGASPPEELPFETELPEDSPRRKNIPEETPRKDPDDEDAPISEPSERDNKSDVIQKKKIMHRDASSLQTPLKQ